MFQKVQSAKISQNDLRTSHTMDHIFGRVKEMLIKKLSLKIDRNNIYLYGW